MLTFSLLSSISFPTFATLLKFDVLINDLSKLFLVSFGAYDELVLQKLID